MAKEKPMSGAARRRHLSSDGTGPCPYCKADLEEVGEYDEISPVEDGGLEQTVECTSCKRRWIDVFKLVDVREIVSRSED